MIVASRQEGLAKWGVTGGGRKKGIGCRKNLERLAWQGMQTRVVRKRKGLRGPAKTSDCLSCEVQAGFRARQCGAKGKFAIKGRRVDKRGSRRGGRLPGEEEPIRKCSVLLRKRHNRSRLLLKPGKENGVRLNMARQDLNEHADEIGNKLGEPSKLGGRTICLDQGCLLLEVHRNRNGWTGRLRYPLVARNRKLGRKNGS